MTSDLSDPIVIDIPLDRHPSLIYGRHWQTPSAEGHYVRLSSSQEYLAVRERPDLSWGTAADARRSDCVVTLAAVRAALSEHQPPRPAHRPRRDPTAARVNLVVRVHPDTRQRLIAEAQSAGVSQGEMLDRWARDHS